MILPTATICKQSDWCCGLRRKRVAKHGSASSHSYKRAPCWTGMESLRGQRTEGFEPGSPAAARRDGVAEAVVAEPPWHGAASASRRTPGSCALACLWAVPEGSPMLRSPRCAGSVLWISAPSKPGCGDRRITAPGPLRGDSLRSKVFSCVYQYISLQHLFHSCTISSEIK